MALPSPGSQASSWLDEVAAELLGDPDLPTATIRVLDFPNAPDGSEYNPDTDAGPASAPIVVLPDRPALVSRTNSVAESAGANEWSTRRRYAFDIDIREGDPLILKGMILRVVDGGRDSALEHFAFQVISAGATPLSPLRRIETVSEMSPVIW